MIQAFAAIFPGGSTMGIQPRQMENLGRGLIAMKTDDGVYVSWRWLGTEPEEIAFNLYRDGCKVNEFPIGDRTNYADSQGTADSTYYVCAVLDGKELAPSEPAGVWDTPYLTVPLQGPEGGISPDGMAYTYNANDASVGDWREEVIWRTEDSTELRVYSTDIPSGHRFRTLMHDPVYRLAVAWQNVCCNQPPHPGFYLGHGMEKPSAPAIYTVKGEAEPV
jgi:hypothetical protein